MKKNYHILKKICRTYNIPHEIVSFAGTEAEKAKALAVTLGERTCYINSSYFGCFPTDSKISAKISRSKQVSKTILDMNGFKTPRTINYTSQDVGSERGRSLILESVHTKGISYPLVIKPSRGRHGIGIQFPKSEDELRTELTPTAQSDNQRKDRWSIEEYIPGREYRIFSVFGKPLFTYHKDGGDYKTANITTGGSYDEFTTDMAPFLNDYCKKIYNVTGISVCGIDLKTSRANLTVSRPEDLTILEINTNPGLGVVEKERGIDFIYQHIWKPVSDRYFSVSN